MLAPRSRELGLGLQEGAWVPMSRSLTSSEMASTKPLRFFSALALSKPLLSGFNPSLFIVPRQAATCRCNLGRGGKVSLTSPKTSSVTSYLGYFYSSAQDITSSSL